MEHPFYKTSSDQFYPADGFANVKMRLAQDREPFEKLSKFLKGTTYTIGKKDEPHYLNTVQKVDFDQKKRNDIKAAPGRYNQQD